MKWATLLVIVLTYERCICLEGGGTLKPLSNHKDYIDYHRYFSQFDHILHYPKQTVNLYNDDYYDVIRDLNAFNQANGVDNTIVVISSHGVWGPGVGPEECAHFRDFGGNLVNANLLMSEIDSETTFVVWDGCLERMDSANLYPDDDESDFEAPPFRLLDDSFKTSRDCTPIPHTKSFSKKIFWMYFCLPGETVVQTPKKWVALNNAVENKQFSLASRRLPFSVFLSGLGFEISKIFGKKAFLNPPLGDYTDFILSRN